MFIRGLLAIANQVTLTSAGHTLDSLLSLLFFSSSARVKPIINRIDFFGHHARERGDKEFQINAIKFKVYV